MTASVSEDDRTTGPWGQKPHRDDRTIKLPSGLPGNDGRCACAALRDHGHEAWLVGGCVRDLLLGRDVHDVDVATSATPEQTAACFAKVLSVGAAFGVQIAVHPSGRSVEIATFRCDGAYIDGRRPSAVTFATAVEDVHRRDFTINALLLDPLTGAVADHVGGLADLAARTIRVIDGPGRLAEDRLRVLRALRFAAHLGFTIEPATWAALVSTPLDGLSRERIWQELDKGLVQEPAAWYRLVVDAGKPGALCPFVGFDPVVGAALAEASAIPDLRLALLLSPVADDRLLPWLDGEPLPRQRVGRLRWLRQAAGVLRAAPPVAARRRLLRHADAPLLAAYLQALKQVPVVAEWFAAEQAAEPLPPLVQAADLLAAGLAPGPGIGAALRAVEDARLEGRIATRDEAMALALQVARNRG